MEENSKQPEFHKTSRGREVVQVDYKKLDQGDQEQEWEQRSQISWKSKCSVKSVKSVGSVAKKKSNKKGKDTDNAEMDSRAGDFDTQGEEDDILSTASDDSRMKKLQEELELNGIMLAERYSDQKIQEGSQVLLEDAPLPEGLEVMEIYHQSKKEHEEQLMAMEDRGRRVARTLELMEMREKIIDTWEQAWRMEWAAELRNKKAELKRNQMILDRKCQKMEMMELQKEEEWQWEEFKLLQNTEMGQTHKGQAKAYKNLNTKNVEPPATSSRLNEVLSNTQRVNNRPGDHVADWVSHHSMLVETTMQVPMHDIRARAQWLIDAKKRTRPPIDYSTECIVGATARPNLGSCPNKGIQHLKKLQLVPEKFGWNSTEEVDEDYQEEMDVNHKSKLLNFFRDGEFGCREFMNNGTATKTQIKSGKYVKSNVNIKKQEIWPHTAVSKKYAKRSTFDNLDFEAFVAGEARIVRDMIVRQDPEAEGRLCVLSLVAYWVCRSRNWPVVRGLYESIIEEVELGERTWNDDFSSHENVLAAWQPQLIGEPGNVSDKGRKQQEVYWCKLYQTGSCEQHAPHMAQLRAEDPPVPVLHICAFCWANFKKRKEHPEAECTTKKG